MSLCLLNRFSLGLGEGRFEFEEVLGQTTTALPRRIKPCLKLKIEIEIGFLSDHPHLELPQEVQMRQPSW
jgi:hypothetical protein